MIKQITLSAIFTAITLLSANSFAVVVKQKNNDDQYINKYVAVMKLKNALEKALYLMSLMEKMQTQTAKVKTPQKRTAIPLRQGFGGQRKKTGVFTLRDL